MLQNSLQSVISRYGNFIRKIDSFENKVSEKTFALPSWVQDISLMTTFFSNPLVDSFLVLAI